MPLLSYNRATSSKLQFRALIAFQLIILVLIYFQARTSEMWLWAIISFVPTTLVCLIRKKEKEVLLSLSLLFFSQFAMFIFAQPTWGYGFNSDSINDLQIASILSEEPHFDLGRVGYTERNGYSYYPLLHLFSVSLSKISGIPLNSIALYVVPFLNALLVPVLLYYLNYELFGLQGNERNIATLLFSTGWYYSFFYSQFVREVFAFPFALLCLLLVAKIAKNPRYQYAIIFTIISVAVTLSHHITSYLLLVIFALIVLGINVSGKNNMLSRLLLLMTIIVSAYAFFVAFDFMIMQGYYAFAGLQRISGAGSFSILKPFEEWQRYLVYTYYLIIAAFALAGGIKLLKRAIKRENWVIILLIMFFGSFFMLCVLLRLSTPADAWSWTYYMSLRGTIWSFIGIAVSGAVGMVFLFSKHRTPIYALVIVLLVCLLAAGKFAQNSPIISDPTTALPVTYSRFTAALWLKEQTVHGSALLVAPTEDVQSFGASRDLAPYAYLGEYFLDESTRYEQFNGYIAFVGSYFEQFRNDTSIQKIYTNGETDVGYKGTG